MKKIIIPILVGAVLVIGGVIILKSKKPISEKPSSAQPATQVNKFQGEINVCELFPKEKISQFLGKEITKAEVATSKINPEPSCYYYLGTKTVYLELNRNSDINEQINGWKALDSTAKEEAQIPLKNFVVYTPEGKVRRIYLIIDEKTFLTIDNWGLGLSKDEELSFASKLANYLKSEFGVK
jgi:hypothetical protein